MAPSGLSDDMTTCDTTHHTGYVDYPEQKATEEMFKSFAEVIEQEIRKENEKHGAKNFKPRTPVLHIRKVEKRIKRFNQKIRKQSH